MSSWNKIKDETEELVLLVSSKLPGKMIIWLTFSVCLLIIFVIGFGIGFGSGNSSACKFGDCAVPVYYYVNNHSESCPPLIAERPSQLFLPVRASRDWLWNSSAGVTMYLFQELSNVGERKCLMTDIPWSGATYQCVIQQVWYLFSIGRRHCMPSLSFAQVSSKEKTTTYQEKKPANG